MSTRRNKRIWSELDTRAVLASIETCRRETGKATLNAPIHGPEYRILERLRRAIDDVGTVLTGNPKLFHGNSPIEGPSRPLFRAPDD